MPTWASSRLQVVLSSKDAGANQPGLLVAA